MSLAACEERCARLRTSVATTAKPRPASPARAASTAALSASRLVCRAISSITPMMSEILREESSIRAMASTALATTSPPRSATLRVLGRELVGLHGVLGVLLHGRGELFHRGRGLFQAGGLLLGALGEVGRAGRDLARRVGDVLRGDLDVGEDRADLLHHRVGRGRDLADFVLAADTRHRHGEIACGDAPGAGRRAPRSAWKFRGRSARQAGRRG